MNNDAKRIAKFHDKCVSDKKVKTKEQQNKTRGSEGPWIAHLRNRSQWSPFTEIEVIDEFANQTSRL